MLLLSFYFRRATQVMVNAILMVALTAITLAAVVGLARPADARQVALVIGNAAYERTPPLNNPKRDAGAMADRFRDLGFEVLEAFDADTAAMARAVDGFIAAARNADFAAFYFAGHGVQLFDRNVLLGRDADPATARSSADLGIDLAALARRLREAGPVRSALIVDACRDNPFSFEQTVALMRRVGDADGAAGGGGQIASLEAAARSARGQRGLAAVTPPSGGATGAGETLFMFAAQPGMVSFDGEGQNSYFVEGLRAALAKPGQPLSMVLQEASAYVRTVTRGGQVPQVVSDWTGDVVLGRTETAKVRHVTSSSKPGDAPLTAEESRVIGEAARPLQRLFGTFIVQERQQFAGGDAFLEASPDKRRRAAALGSVNGFAIDYDLDRDGRPETIAAYFRQVEVYLEVVDEGVSKLEPVCGRDDDKVGTDDHDPVTAVEIALRDLDGDRRPEVVVHFTTEKGGWGDFCILQYVGDGLLAADARGAAVDVRSERSAFRVLLRGGGETVLFGADNTVATCGGSNCHTRSVWTYDGQQFRLTLDQSQPPEPAAAQPFTDEADRAAKLAAWTGPRGRPGATGGDRIAPSSPADQAAVRKRFEAEVEAFVVERYLKDGQRDGRIGLAYAPNLTYYGKYLTRAQVLADKASYYARWPERSYRLTPGSLTITGDASGADVTFTYGFAVANAGKRSVGKGRTTLRIRKEAGEFMILQEAGEVLKP